MLNDDLAVAVILAVIAPFIGSFLAVVAMRLPAGRTVLFGRSHCDACGHVLGPLDLFPLASFLAMRGKCRHCGGAIDPFHPAMELGALAVVLWAALVTTGWVLIASVALGWVLLTLGAIDWRTGFLPDVLTYPLLIAGLIAAYLMDAATLSDHVVGAVAGGAFFAALAWTYRRIRGRDGMGLGDAKFLAAIGAWVSWEGLPTVVLLAALIGIAGAVIAARRGTVLEGESRIPFGPPLALAAWIVWLHGPIVPGWLLPT